MNLRLMWISLTLWLQAHISSVSPSSEQVACREITLNTNWSNGRTSLLSHMPNYIFQSFLVLQSNIFVHLCSQFLVYKILFYDVFCFSLLSWIWLRILQVRVPLQIAAVPSSLAVTVSQLQLPVQSLCRILLP